jgi:hypothetical protein
MASLRRTLSFGRLYQGAKRVAAEGSPGKEFHPATIFFPIYTGAAFRSEIRYRPSIRSSGCVQPGVGGFDFRERLGQRLEIAGILEPTVSYALVRSAQPPELGLVGFGNAVDVGGDLNTWCAGSARLIA